MNKRRKNIAAYLLAVIILVIPTAGISPIPVSKVQAKESKTASSSRETVKQLLAGAYQMQIDLNKPKPLREVKRETGKYMAAEFERRFLKERLVIEITGPDKGRWSVPGSDDMYLFIPDYSWDKRTVIQKGPGQTLYVSQFYPYEEGPWSIGNHTETVVLVKEAGKWKVGNILYEEGKKLFH
jgi:hypothetical protein